MHRIRTVCVENNLKFSQITNLLHCCKVRQFSWHVLDNWNTCFFENLISHIIFRLKLKIGSLVKPDRHVTMLALLLGVHAMQVKWVKLQVKIWWRKKWKKPDIPARKSVDIEVMLDPQSIDEVREIVFIWPLVERQFAIRSIILVAILLYVIVIVSVDILYSSINF